MKIKQEYTFVGARRYSFQDKSTGRDVKGTSVHIINHDVKQEDDVFGYSPMKLSAPYELFDDLSKCKVMSVVPFELDVVMNGQNTSLKIVGISQ